MIRIGLDLAYRTVGISIATKDKLYHTSHDLSKERLPTPAAIYHMVDQVWVTIEPYLSEPHILVLEEIFKGKWENLKNIARVQGGVIVKYVQKTGKNPVFTFATDARKRLGIPIIAPKVAIQLWVLDKTKMDGAKKLDKIYRTHLEELIQRYYQIYNSGRQRDKKRLKQLEKEFDQHTLTVAQLTGLDNHAADAIVLALQAGL